MTSTTRALKRSRARLNKQAQRRLYRFAFILWGVVALLALVLPWAYGLVAVFFATFLTFAALD